MNEETIGSLARLLPEVAIAVVFGLILMYYMKQSGLAHKEKTMEFVAYNKERDMMMRDIMEKQNVSSDRLAKNIEANTVATQQMRETLNQLLIQHK